MTNLTTQHLTIGYTHGRRTTAVLADVNVALRPGELTCLIGPNGAGKSTLFHLISGRYTPSAGSIRLRGEEIGGMAPQLI
ncbi:MAG: ATP-binding cassette domain-containing protein, partial [Caldilineaceae bacterium]|nr:ATP-binding cassette domain-containing protein [Caldilineaceae bacterium]